MKYTKNLLKIKKIDSVLNIKGLSKCWSFGVNKLIGSKLKNLWGNLQNLSNSKHRKLLNFSQEKKLTQNGVHS